ncbi:unnamed protein product [Lampetra planeri]
MKPHGALTPLSLQQSSASHERVLIAISKTFSKDGAITASSHTYRDGGNAGHRDGMQGRLFEASWQHKASP